MHRFDSIEKTLGLIKERLDAPDPEEYDSTKILIL